MSSLVFDSTDKSFLYWEAIIYYGYTKGINPDGPLTKPVSEFEPSWLPIVQHIDAYQKCFLEKLSFCTENPYF